MLLREAAGARLAQVLVPFREQYGETVPTLDVLVLRIGSEHFALPSLAVREVTRYRAWTVVPGAPPTLPGIISQRGTILPIVDLRPLLDLPDTALERAARFVVVQHGEFDLALLAEAVLDLVSIEEAAFAPPPGSDARRRRFVRGLAEFAGQPLALIDLDPLIETLREGGGSA